MESRRAPFAVLKALAALLLLLATVNRGVEAGQCKEGCPSPNTQSKYKFLPGHVYEYKVDSYVTVYLSGKDNQETTLKVNGVAQVFAGDNCQYTLKLTRLTIFGPDGKKAGIGPDILKPVKFVLSNDELSPEICAETDDSEFSLNVKRGIISLLQNAEGKSFETDVFGVCPTTHSSTPDGNAVVVTKTRDLNACGHRESLSEGFIKGIFNERSGIKAAPVLNGDYRLEQRIEDGILKSAQLSEEYHYLPFSSQDAGARTKVSTTLIFTSDSAKPAPDLKNGNSRPILFTSSKPVPTVNLNVLKNAFKNTLVAYEDHVGPEAAGKFSELVRLFRNAKKEDLGGLYQQVKAGTLSDNKELAQKIYFDALFRAGTGSSVEVIANLLKSRDIGEKESHLAYLSLNVVNSVTKESLAAIAKILDNNSPREAYLGVGSLVSKYCRDHKCTPAELKAVTDKFSAKLGACKPGTRQDEDAYVAILKGIRNSDNLFQPALDKVLACTSDKSSSRVRIAALQALAANPCNRKLQNAALTILKNRIEDSEVRIEAYLALTQCPSATIANEIKSLLNDEPIYQVGFFISSHLSNIRASADPHRETLRHHLGGIRPSQKFPSDFRRYSFNREFSYAVDSLGLGASVDSSVIYSQTGFLPRSGRFNLTGELFGNIFNVFEISARQENLESVVEHYFGPRGVFKTSSPQELYNSVVKNYKTIAEKTQSRFNRRRRGVKEDVAAFGSKVQLTNEVFNDIDLDISFKFFGSELYFLSLGHDMPNSPKEFVDKFFGHLDKGIQQIKDFNHVYERHVIFLDFVVAYPLGIGFPLKLSVQGTGAAKFDVGLKVDAKNFRKNPSYELRFIPSFNIELEGSLTVDSFVAETGLQVTGSLHSATGSNVKFVAQEGKKFDLNVDFPFKKQEVFSFDHKIVFVVRERGQESVEVPLKFTAKKKDFINCFDQLQKYVGVVLCTNIDVSVPEQGSAAFPLSGPNHVGLSFEIDPHYQFSGLLEELGTNHSRVTYTFDTPGSSDNRKTALSLEVAYNDQYFGKLALDSPYRAASVEAGFKRTPEEVAFYAAGKNGPEEYLAKIGFKVQGNEQRAEYTPLIEFKTPQTSQNTAMGYKVEGKIVVEKLNGGTKYGFNNVKVISPAQEPYSVNGFIARDQHKTSADLKLVDEKQNKHANIKGLVDYEPNDHLKLEFELEQDYKDSANVKINYELQKKPNLLFNHLIFVYGKDLKSSTNLLEIYQKVDFERDEDKSLKSATFEKRISIPGAPNLLSLTGDYKKNSLHFDFKAEYNPYVLQVYTKNKYNAKATGDFDVQFGGKLNKHNVDVVTKRVIGQDKTNVDAKLTSSIGFELEANLEHNTKISPDDANVDAKVRFVHQGKTPYSAQLTTVVTQTTFNSDAKILEGSTELAHYSAQGSRGETSEGKFDVTVKDVVEGNGNFKAVKGKGNGNILFNFNKLDRKIKVETEFNVASPNYESDTTVFYDFEKDNSKKLAFSTHNKVQKDEFKSKNSLEIFSEKYTFNVFGQQAGQIRDGTTTANVEVGLPTGRKLTGTLSREVHYKKDDTNAKFNAKVSDKLADGKERSLEFSGDVKGFNLNALTADVNYNVKYVNLDQKDVTLNANIKRTPHGDKQHSVIDLTAGGSLLTESVVAHYEVSQSSAEKAEYKANGNYGQKFTFKVDGRYNLEQDAKPWISDVKGEVTFAEGQLKQVAFESFESYKAPEGENGEHEGAGRFVFIVNDNRFAFDGNGKGNENQGAGTFRLELPQTDPISVKGSFAKEEVSKDSEKGTVTLSVDYGKGKKIGFRGQGSYAPKDVNVAFDLTTPIEKAKHVVFDLKSKRSNENTHQGAITLDVDDRHYGYNSLIVLSDSNPKLELELNYLGKTSKLTTGVNKLDDNKYNGELNVENFGEFNFVGTFEAQYVSVESFYLKAAADAPKLKLNKVNVEVNSKPGSGGKGVDFKATSDGKNILSGTADYNVKDEKGKLIIEGQGNVKVYENQKTTTFKFIKNTIDDKEGEKGISYVFNGQLGTQNIVSEFKLTNRNLRLKHTVCEEKKQCINIDLLSSLRKTEFENFHHELVASVDLRELGYSHEFGLKAETKRQGFTFDHTVDMHLQSQDKNKYQYSLYVQPKQAGVALTLPTRVIALESVYNYPTEEFFGKYDAHVAFYTDKANKPNDKTSLNFNGDLSRNGNAAVTGKAAVKFDHPLIKPLQVKGSLELNADTQLAAARVEFDVFKAKNKAIVAEGRYENVDKSGKGFNVTTTLKISSAGLNLDLGFDGHAAFNYDQRRLSVAASAVAPTKDFQFGEYLYLSDQAFELYGTVFNQELIKVVANYDLNKRTAELSSVLRYLGASPITIDSRLSGLTSASFIVAKGDLLSAKGTFDLTKEASLDVVGNKKQLFKGKVSLDESHFLASEYNVQEGDVKQFLTELKQYVKVENENAKKHYSDKVQALRTAVTDQFKSVKDSFPEFDKIQQEYRAQLDKFTEELKADPSIKEIADFIRSTFLTFSETYDEIVKTLTEYYKKFYAQITELYNQLEETFNSRILPSLKQIYGQFETLIFSVYEETVNLFSAVFERIVKALKTFEQDFNKVSAAFSDSIKNFAAAFKDYIETLDKELRDLYQILVDHVQELPGFDYLKEQYHTIFEQYNLPEQALNIFKELTSTLKDAVPTKEVGDFLQLLTDYVEAKFTRKEVKDLDQIKKIVVAFVKALQSVVNQIRLPGAGDVQGGAGFLGGVLPFSTEAFKRIPYISNVRFSLFNCFRNQECFSVRDLLRSYRPHSFTFGDFLPPFTLSGHLGDGQHVFTFDGRHITFPGNCKYVLAQDFKDGNFALVANLENGNLASIVLVDKSGSLELKKNGQVLYNDQPSELPVHAGDLHAWRRYYSVSLLSSYGASVLCSTDLRVCHVTVSGYYLGRIRGLLGNGNNEPYDDFLLPNGQITEDDAEFGNGYGLTEGCPAVPKEEHNHQSSDVCSDLFSGSSSLRFCFLFIDHTNYREACEHAVAKASNKQDAACNIALVYASNCRIQNIPILLPSQCTRCTEAGVGDRFSVKAPQKKADVVIVADTKLFESDGDLIQNTVTDLRKELAARDLSDVHLSLIGYNTDRKYLNFYTTNGDLDFNGKVAELKDETQPIEEPIKTGHEKLDNIVENSFKVLKRVKEDLGLSLDAHAFAEALRYPWRSTAAKTILVIRGESLSHPGNAYKAIGGLIANQLAARQGISTHVVAPIKNLNIAGASDAKAATQVVGFNKNTVLQTTDGKKRPGGSPDLRSSVTYDIDLGIDLVQASGGYVFPLQNYEALKGKERKQYAQVLSSALADQLSRTENQADCVCVLSYGLFAEEKCFVTDSTVLPPTKKGA